MRLQDNERFVDLVMNPLYLAFEKKPDDVLTAMYFAALRRFEFDAVRRAVDQAISRLKFFPKVAELIVLIEGDPEVRSHEAWERVLQTIRHVGYASRVDFQDPAIHAAVQAMGGWRTFWFLDRLPSDELGFKALEFRKLYTAYRRDLPSDTPTVLGDDLALNPIRVIDRRGLPEAPTPRALAAPEEPIIDVRERWQQLVEDLAEHHRPPEPIRRMPKALTAGDMPPTPEVEERRRRRQQEQLERFHQQYGQAMAGDEAGG
jgi:Domain of unknown function (DUF6475)